MKFQLYMSGWDRWGKSQRHVSPMNNTLYVHNVVTHRSMQGKK